MSLAYTNHLQHVYKFLLKCMHHSCSQYSLMWYIVINCLLEVHYSMFKKEEKVPILYSEYKIEEPTFLTKAFLRHFLALPGEKKIQLFCPPCFVKPARRNFHVLFFLSCYCLVILKCYCLVILKRMLFYWKMLLPTLQTLC